MKFLIIAALVAVAAADYHDDTFHFSTLGSVSGLQKGAFLQSSSPVLAKKVTTFSQPAFTKQYTTVQSSPAVYSSVVAQPAYTQQYSTVKQVAAPVLFKSIEQEIPVYSQQYTQQIAAQPVYTQQYAVKQVAQPVYTQQYAVKQVAQPVYSQYSAVKEIAQPVYTQQYAVKQVAQPAFTQYSAVKPAVYSQTQYSAVQPAVYSQTQYSAVKPAVYSQTQYSAVKPTVYSQTQQYSAVQPAVYSQTQYSAKPLIAQQYSAVSGASSYAPAYQGAQFRILSQVQETDPTGPYRVSYSTENGIQASEEGHLINGAEGAVVAAQGSYSYTGPDGVVYTVNYTADENGFQAAGDHLPTPPPIPAEILRSLEENAASGEQYDEEGKLLKK